MNTFVIDASIAVKWVVEEHYTPEALALYQRAKLIAPELLVAECANILWKKVQRQELSKPEALSRTGVLPDFFIGAHAAVAQVPLLTRDPRPYRTYFTGIALIAPDETAEF